MEKEREINRGEKEKESSANCFRITPVTCYDAYNALHTQERMKPSN